MLKNIDYFKVRNAMIVVLLIQTVLGAISFYISVFEIQPLIDKLNKSTPTHSSTETQKFIDGLDAAKYQLFLVHEILSDVGWVILLFLFGLANAIIASRFRRNITVWAITGSIIPVLGLAALLLIGPQRSTYNK